MPRFLRFLSVVVVLAGVAILASESSAKPPTPTAQAQLSGTWLAKALRALREDIDIDLPDDRGAKLGAIVDQAVLEVRQLQRASRAGASRAELHKLSVDLDKILDRLVAAAASLGSDGYYLRKAAAQINAENESLARVLAPPSISPKVFALTDQLHKGLHALREDIDIDIPDARGRATTEITERALGNLRQVYRGARFGAPSDNLRNNVVELNKDLGKIVETTKAIGTDGYYLNRSAAQLLALGRELHETLSKPSRGASGLKCGQRRTSPAQRARRR